MRRRFDTIARPARVRIRSRKPCTRARRRLFGWKVRLPLATAFSSLSLAQVFEPSAHHASRLRSFADRSEVSPAAGRRGPQSHRAGSQPYRRRSGDCLRVLTSHRWVKLGLRQRPQPVHPRKPSLSGPPLRHHIGSRQQHPHGSLKKPIGMQQNGWQPHGKLLTSGNAVSEWNGARRLSEDGGSTSCLGDLHGLSPARRSRAVADRLRLVYDHPVHTCV